MSDGRGGARPGAGRKQKRVKFARPIAQAEKKIADKLVHLAGKALELAEGVPILDDDQLKVELDKIEDLINQAEDLCGDTAEIAEMVQQFKDAVTHLKEIYRTPPDLKAIEYLMNRIMGKPTEKKEITGENGGPIVTEQKEVPNLSGYTDEELTQMRAIHEAANARRNPEGTS